MMHWGAFLMSHSGRILLSNVFKSRQVVNHQLWTICFIKHPLETCKHFAVGVRTFWIKRTHTMQKMYLFERTYTGSDVTCIVIFTFGFQTYHPSRSFRALTEEINTCVVSEFRARLRPQDSITSPSASCQHPLTVIFQGVFFVASGMQDHCYLLPASFTTCCNTRVAAVKQCFSYWEQLCAGAELENPAYQGWTQDRCAF